MDFDTTEHSEAQPQSGRLGALGTRARAQELVDQPDHRRAPEQAHRTGADPIGDEHMARMIHERSARRRSRRRYNAPSAESAPAGASNRMIELYTWSTPNGRKVSIMLEELGMQYQVHAIDITRGGQYAPEFLAISPNNKIPAIVDTETGISMMESGAILLYLAERGGRLLPREEHARWRTIEWLMWQMGGIGPLLGQAHHFLHFNPGKAPYAERRYRDEAERLYGVLERRLAEVPWLAGAEYTVADIATWPWISRFEWQGIDLNRYPHARRWYLEIAARPAVQRGFRVPNPAEIPMP